MSRTQLSQIRSESERTLIYGTTYQDMLSPDLPPPPIHPRLLRWGRFKPCFGPGYFLLQLSNCIMETCMLLAGVRVHEHWLPQWKPLGWEWGFKKLNLSSSSSTKLNWQTIIHNWNWFNSISIYSVYNPHSNPSGCYGVADARWPSPQPLWPDLAKFCHIRKILNSFWPSLELLFSIWQNC